MHATAAPVQPAQASLLPQLQIPPPAPDRPVRLAIWGLLLEPAKVLTSTDGQTHLQVLVAQHLQRHPAACPILATYHYPDQACPATTALAAADKAHRMRAGTEVVVTGVGLAPGRHHGAPVNVLHQVRAIALASDLTSDHLQG